MQGNFRSKYTSILQGIDTSENLVELEESQLNLKSEIVDLLDSLTTSDIIEDSCATFKSFSEFEHSQYQAKPRRNFEFDLLTNEDFDLLRKCFRQDFAPDANALDLSIDGEKRIILTENDKVIVKSEKLLQFERLLASIDDHLIETFNARENPPHQVLHSSSVIAIKGETDIYAPGGSDFAAAREAIASLPPVVKKKRGGQKKVKIEGDVETPVKVEPVDTGDVASPPQSEKKTRGRRPNKAKDQFETDAPDVSTQIALASMGAAVNPYAVAKGKASRGSLNPIEVLKALFTELEGHGLPVFSPETRIGDMLVSCVRAAETKKYETTESIVSECVQELVNSAVGDDPSSVAVVSAEEKLQMEEDEAANQPATGPVSLLSLLSASRDGIVLNDNGSETCSEAPRTMSISRAASTVASEYLTSFRDGLEEFDATFYTIKKDTIDRYRRKWDSLYSYNQHVNTPDVIQAAAIQAQLEAEADVMIEKLEGDSASTALVVPSDPLLAGNPFFGRKVPLEELPVAFDRIPNPFDNYGEDASRYDWLTSTTTVRTGLSSTLSAAALAVSQTDIVTLLNSPPKLTRETSAPQVADEERKVDLNSTTHPFIHHQSLYFGKAPLRACMHTMFADKIQDGSLLGGGALPSFSALASSMSILNATLNSMTSTSAEPSQSMVEHCAAGDEEETEANAAQKAYARSLSNPENWPLTMKQCLGAAYSVLNLGLNPIIVDQQASSEDENSFKAAVHRASLVATIICNYCGRSNNEVKAVATAASDVVPAAGRRKSNTVTVVHENWGPVLVVVRLKDLADYETALRLQCTTEFKLQVLSYYGNENDRTLLRSYIKGAGGGVGANGSVRKGLYAERSHAHVVLINYESLLLDLHHFKDIFWFHIVFDQSWGLFSNNRYTAIQTQLHTLLHSRQRLYVSGGLVRQQGRGEGVTETVLPSSVDVTRNVFPQALGTLPVNNTTGAVNTKIVSAALDNSIEHDQKCGQYLLKLLASLTCVCAEDGSAPSDSVSESVFGLLAQLEWSGIQLQHSTDASSAPTDCDVYSLNTGSADCLLLRHPVHYSTCYIDRVLDRELRLLKLGAVGLPGNHARTMFDQEAADEYASYSNYSTSSGGDQSGSGTGRGGRGRGGRGRGRSWKRGPDDEFGNYTTVSIETGLVVEGGAAAAGRGAGGGRGRGAGRGRGGPGSRGGRVNTNAGRGRGRGRGRGAAALSSPVPDEEREGEKQTHLGEENGAEEGHELMMEVDGDVEGDHLKTDIQQEFRGEQPSATLTEEVAATAIVELFSPSAAADVPVISTPASPSAMQLESPAKEEEKKEDVTLEADSRKRRFSDLEQTSPEPTPAGEIQISQTDSSSAATLSSDMASEAHAETASVEVEVTLPGKKPRRKSNPTANANYLYHLDNIDEDVAVTSKGGAAARKRKRDPATEAAIAEAMAGADAIQKAAEAQMAAAPIARVLNSQYSAAHTAAAVSATYAAATKAALSTKPSVSFEQEREKCVTHKGAVWQAVIPLVGRTKFLGVFSNSKHAFMAFEFAYRQRESDVRDFMTTTGSSVAQDTLNFRKLKGRGGAGIVSGKEIRLLDGSYIASEYYKHMPTSALLNEVASMASTQLFTGHSLNEFISTNCPPPAYAILEGPHGYSVPITYCNTVLGRSSSRIHDLMVDSLGDTEHGAEGLQYKFQNRYNSQTDDHCADWRNHHVAVHIGFDKSIADQHAVIVYNDRTGRFEITSISHAGVFLNGELVLPEDGPRLLSTKSVIQIGSVIFYFLLPLQLTNIYMHSPLQQRENVLVSLLESVRLRDLHFRREEATRQKLSNATAVIVANLKAVAVTDGPQGDERARAEQQSVQSVQDRAAEEEAREEQDAQDEDKILKAMQLYELLSVNCGYRVKSGSANKPIAHPANTSGMSKANIPVIVRAEAVKVGISAGVVTGGASTIQVSGSTETVN